MADKDPRSEPSLELPSFGFGRKKKRGKGEAAAPAPGPVAEPAAESAPVAEPVAEPEPAAEPAPVAEPPAAPDTEPSTTEPTTAAAAAAPAARRPRLLRRKQDTTTESPAESASEAPPEPTEAPTPAAAPEAGAAPVASPLDDDPAAEDVPAKPKKEFTLPAIPGLAAAVVSGVVVGLLAVLLTGLSLRLCELVKGSTSCGGPGLLLLIAILILLTYVGGWLLRAWRINDPTSTSFLAVGLMAVIAMLFLIDALFSPWMLLVIPLVAAATYALSWWVTQTFVDVED